MAVDERIIEALKLQWYAMDALYDELQLVVKASGGEGQIDGLLKARLDAWGTKEEFKAFVQGLESEV